MRTCSENKLKQYYDKKKKKSSIVKYFYKVQHTMRCNAAIHYNINLQTNNGKYFVLN